MNIPEINYELLSETNEFQEKLDSLITSKVESAKKSTTEKTKIQLLRAEYYELAGKRCAPSWDEATLELKINELKA